jgi:hypothetical protein
MPVPTAHTGDVRGRDPSELLSDQVVVQLHPLRQENPASAAPYRGAVSFNHYTLDEIERITM